MKKQHLLAAGAIALVAAFGLSACSSSSSGSSASDKPSGSASAAASGNGSLSKLVPAEYRGKTLSVVDGNSNPPMYGQDANGKVNGITIDLANAAAQLLGVKLDVSVNSFDASIPGLQSGKYDLSLWATDLTPDREAILDQIPIGDVGYSFLTLASGHKLADDMNAVCGKSIAAIAGQTTITVLQAQSKTCTSAGKGAIQVSTFPDQASATLAVKSGRADAATINSVSGGYAAKQDKTLQLTGPVFNKNLTGIATAKGSQLGTAFAAALQELVKNGTYKKIIAKYGADSMLIDDISVNPSLS